MTSELEFDLRDTLNWVRKWLADFDAGKTQLVWFDWSNNTGAIDVKMEESVLEKKNHLLRCWGWLFLLYCIGVLALSLLLKLPPIKLVPWLVLRSFFLRRLLCISINLQKKTCKTLNYIYHLFILVSIFTGCVSISVFILLLGTLIRIKRSAIGLETCAITAGIINYKSIIDKKNTKHDKNSIFSKDWFK